MSVISYFLPDIYASGIAPGRKLAREVLALRGLDRLLADCEFEQLAVIDLLRTGPGERCGSIVVPLPASGIAPVRLGYFPNEQHWAPAHGREDTLWLAIDSGERPTPAALRRHWPLVSGHDVTLADGQTWHVPIVRRPTGTTRLPCRLSFSGDNQIVEQVYERHSELFADLEPVATIFWNGGKVERLLGCHLAMRCLAVNYRLGTDEQNVLGLLDSENWVEILKAAIDAPLFERALQKKTSPATPS